MSLLGSFGAHDKMISASLVLSLSSMDLAEHHWNVSFKSCKTISKSQTKKKVATLHFESVHLLESGARW